MGDVITSSPILMTEILLVFLRFRELSSFINFQVFLMSSLRKSRFLLK